MKRVRLTRARLRAAGIGTFFRPRDLKTIGIGYPQLQQLIASGAVEKVDAGLYRVASAEITEHYTRAAVSARIPGAIICLLTALSYHEIGTQLPRDVWIAIPHKARTPRVTGLPIRFVRFSGRYLTEGVDSVLLDGVPARVTTPARTVVDCFRFRRVVGHDVALEAIKWAIRDRKTTPAEIARVADACRAASLVTPYLELLQV